MGGLPACCLPDALTLATKTQDEILPGGLLKKQSPDMVGPLNLAVDVNDEHDTYPQKDKGIIVFRDDRAPGPDRASPPASFRQTAMDSCAMLNDLDFLTSQEWQTMPQATPTALEEKLLKEAESASAETAYPIALRSLWYNCPDALEEALRRVEGLPLTDAQVADARFMAQKLEFTRIRQAFVATCIQFRSISPASASSVDAFRAGVNAAEKRCTALMAAQPDELASQLPGLITKRDTIMLQSRINTITQQLLTKFGTKAAG